MPATCPKCGHQEASPFTCEGTPENGRSHDPIEVAEDAVAAPAPSEAVSDTGTGNPEGGADV